MNSFVILTLCVSRRVGVVLAVLLAGVLAGTAHAAAIITTVGNQSNITWPTAWNAITGFGNEAGSATHSLEFDLVGTSTGPRSMGYWACSPTYVFFRVRIDKPTDLWAGTAGSVFVFIDNSSADSGNNIPDWGFVWDARDNSTALAQHGLEMQQIDHTGGEQKRWSETDMKDVDANPAAKGASDINGDSRADGYVNAHNTTDYDTNGDALIDIAVKWNYLSAYTGLKQQQNWRIAIGSRKDAADHDYITWDVGGLTIKTDADYSLIQDTAWSSTLYTIPEPTALLLLGTAGTLLLARRRRR